MRYANEQFCRKNHSNINFFSTSRIEFLFFVLVYRLDNATADEVDYYYYFNQDYCGSEF